MRLPEQIKRWSKFFCWTVIGGFVCIWCLWAAGAIYYLAFLPKPVAGLLAAVYLIASVVSLFRTKDKRLWLRHIAASVVVVYLLTLFHRPSHNRDWAADNAVMPEIDIDANTVNVSGVRHSVYDSDTQVEVNYSNLTFPLSQLKKVWFVVHRFTAFEGIAHNFLTFSFDTEDGPAYFSVSAEIRREQGEQFSPIKGLYRQYEMIYVIADERDEIGSRAILRSDDRVYMYPVNATEHQVQALFLDIASRVQRLADEPEFYHSLLNNCTNNIVFHTYKLTPEPINWLDPQIVIPGYADRFAYSKRLIGHGVDDFELVQQKFRIDDVIRRFGITANFSFDIRDNAADDFPE